MNNPNIATETILALQDVEHAIVSENNPWLLARESLSSPNAKTDSRAELEELGFTNISEHDDLFFAAKPPDGWSKSTIGYWTSVHDEDDNKRIDQFYKGAFYDPCAHLRIVS